jgi:hypothetical protein
MKHWFSNVGKKFSDNENYSLNIYYLNIKELKATIVCNNFRVVSL